MKNVLLRCITPLLLCSLAARADVVIEQKIESAAMNGGMTMKVKGDKARMDMGGPAGDMSVLMDTATGDMLTLMHSQKMMMKINMNEAMKQGQAAQKAQGIDIAKMEKPVATGKKEKVGEWDTEIYNFNSGGAQGRLWVAKDFPKAQEIKDQMMKVSKAAAQGNFDPNKMDVPGMVVKTEMTMPTGKMTSTVVKISTDPVSDTDFAKPEGYREMAMPTAPAAK